MRNQPEPQKPEWFELLDGDAPSAQVAKVDKKLPIFAAVVIGAALLSGTVFAGANSGGQESAVAATNQIENSTGTSGATSATVGAVSGTTSEALQPSNDSSLRNGSIQNPTVSGVKPPRGGGDDDDDDDDYDDDHEEDDDHRRERRDHDEH